MHHIGLALLYAHRKGIARERAQLWMAYSDGLDSLGHIHPHLAYMIVVGLCHAKRTDVEAESLCRCLYADKGTFLIVLVADDSACGIGGEVFLVILERGDRHGLSHGEECD